jgi:hypothetical protein
MVNDIFLVIRIGSLTIISYRDIEKRCIDIIYKTILNKKCITFFF